MVGKLRGNHARMHTGAKPPRKPPQPYPDRSDDGDNSGDSTNGSERESDIEPMPSTVPQSEAVGIPTSAANGVQGEDESTLIENEAPREPVGLLSANPPKKRGRSRASWVNALKEMEKRRFWPRRRLEEGEESRRRLEEEEESRRRLEKVEHYNYLNEDILEQRIAAQMNDLASNSTFALLQSRLDALLANTETRVTQDPDGETQEPDGEAPESLQDIGDSIMKAAECTYNNYLLASRSAASGSK